MQKLKLKYKTLQIKKQNITNYYQNTINKKINSGKLSLLKKRVLKGFVSGTEIKESSLIGIAATKCEFLRTRMMGK